jgi:hypothetical protein
MRYIFFLLVQKLECHRVEGVRSQLMIPNDDLHHIQLYPTFNIDILVFSDSQCLDIRSLLFDSGMRVEEAAELIEGVGHLKHIRPINKIWKIEILCVVSCDDIWIDLANEFAPGF